MIKIILKKRKKPIPEFEKLGEAFDELRKALEEVILNFSIIKKLGIVGKKGSQAGRELKRTIKEDK